MSVTGGRAWVARRRRLALGCASPRGWCSPFNVSHRLSCFALVQSGDFPSKRSAASRAPSFVRLTESPVSLSLRRATRECHVTSSEPADSTRERASSIQAVARAAPIGRTKRCCLHARAVSISRMASVATPINVPPRFLAGVQALFQVAAPHATAVPSLSCALANRSVEATSKSTLRALSAAPHRQR